MRKLLLGTTALVAATAVISNSALADVSISASTEWTYESRSSNVTANDGTRFDTEGEIAFKFSNKTDSGLTIGYTVELMSDHGDTGVDESTISIAGGFGKVMFGGNDGASENFGMGAQDIIAEENSPGVTSMTIGTSSDIDGLSGNADKIIYHLPAMGGLTMGASFADSGAVGATDTTEFGARYAMDAGNGMAITLAAATGTTEATNTDTDAQNLAVKVVTGNMTFVISQSTKEGFDEDLDNTGAAVSLKMANGMTLGAYTFKSEDALDIGEEYTKSGVELQYVIASGLTAVINVDDYEYKAGTSETTVSDSGTQSSLTIKTSF